MPRDIHERFPFAGADDATVDRAFVQAARQLLGGVPTRGSANVALVPIGTGISVLPILVRLGAALVQLDDRPVLIVESWHRWQAPQASPPELLALRLRRARLPLAVTTAEAVRTLHRLAEEVANETDLVLIDGGPFLDPAGQLAILELVDRVIPVGGVWQSRATALERFVHDLPPAKQGGVLLVG